jgi:GNAT superfamily N-acetyltransferase
MLLLFHRVPVAAFRFDRDSPTLGIIRSMAVEQSLQRQGHGRATILLLIELATSIGFHTLEVNSAPDAVPFYRRLGFDLIGADREAPLLRFELRGVSD